MTGPVRRAAGRLLGLLAPLLCAAWAAGLMTASRRDWLVWLAYLPTPLAFATGVVWWWRARRGAGPALRVLMGALTAAAAIQLLAVDLAPRRRAAAPPRDSLRIVHWNIAHARAGYPAIFKTLLRDEPDILLLSEARFDAEARMIALRKLNLFRGFYEDGLSILSKYPMRALPLPQPVNARACAVTLDTPQGPLDLVLVDVYSHPRLNRAAPMAALAQWVEAHDSGTPLIVAGDFNTLRRSTDFRPLRRRLRHAYEIAGAGWPYTWPAPLPLYDLDHVWVSDRVRVHAYALRVSAASDHLRQVFDVSLPAAP